MELWQISLSAGSTLVAAGLHQWIAFGDVLQENTENKNYSNKTAGIGKVDDLNIFDESPATMFGVNATSISSPVY